MATTRRRWRVSSLSMGHPGGWMSEIHGAMRWREFRSLGRYHSGVLGASVRCMRVLQRGDEGHAWAPLDLCAKLLRGNQRGVYTRGADGRALQRVADHLGR